MMPPASGPSAMPRLDAMVPAPTTVPMIDTGKFSRMSTVYNGITPA